MVPGLELVAGYLVGWALRKARRVGQRADAEVDRVADAVMDRLHDLVERKLGAGDAGLARLDRDAAEGRDDPRTRQRVQLAVEQAAEDDAVFAEQLGRVLRELAEQPTARMVVQQQVNVSGQGQVPVQGSGVQHNVFGGGSG